MGDNKESELVRVNVGGTFYSTTKGTLLSEQDSFFSKILKEKPQQKDDRGGYYFIDRLVLNQKKKTKRKTYQTQKRKIKHIRFLRAWCHYGNQHSAREVDVPIAAPI